MNSDGLPPFDGQVEQIEQTTSDVSEIVSELAVLISSQSEGIEHISAAIENTADRTARARDELRTASRANAQQISRKACLTLAVAGFCLLYLINLFGRHR